MEKVTTDVILEYMKELVESKKSIPKELWLEVAFKLNLLRIDEAKLLNKMRQEVAIEKFSIMGKQEKKNVAAVDLEIETKDNYRFMRDQEDKIWSIDEFIRIAKRNSETDW